MSKTNREQFEAWGMSDTDLRITLECETYAGIAWLAWQAATNEAESQLTALTSQLESVVAENAALKQQTPDVRSASMFEAIEKAEKLMGDGMPELAMVEAFEILKMKRTPATDAFLAEVRNEAGARAVELFSQTLGSPYKVRDEKCYENGFTRAIEIVRDTQAPRFAAQLRKGAQS